MNPYTQLAIDSFLASLFVPMRSELTLSAMQLFGGYNLPLMFVIVMAVSIVGILINWGVMRFSSHALMQDEKVKNSVVKRNYDKVVQVTHNKRLWLLLLLTPVQIIGPLMPVLAGFFNVPLRKTLLLSVGANVIYYVIILVV